MGAISATFVPRGRQFSNPIILSTIAFQRTRCWRRAGEHLASQSSVIPLHSKKVRRVLGSEPFIWHVFNFFGCSPISYPFHAIILTHKSWPISFSSTVILQEANVYDVITAMANEVAGQLDEGKFVAVDKKGDDDEGKGKKDVSL